MDFPNSDIELSYWNKNQLVAGVDEAGRGPLAGPVVASAVILSSESLIIGLNDSKKLSDKARRKIYEAIYKNALDIGVGFVFPEEIDEINILQASVKAMKIAIENLRVVPQHLLIDGNYFTDYHLPYTTIVKGDANSISIAAASIVAKVTRDDWMINNAHSKYPEYGFDKHKGYPTEFHYQRIDKYGISDIHRKSFLHSKIEPQQSLF